MRVLVNASPIVIGGGIQVAASFIAEAKKTESDFEWYFVLSRQVANELESLGVDPNDDVIFEVSPTFDRDQKKRLQAIEDDFQPAVVFTVFGPAYVKFKAPHLCGIAVGWVTHSNALAFSTLGSMKAKVAKFLSTVGKGFAVRNADRWLVEANNSKQGLRKRLLIPADKIDIVANTTSAVFAESDVPPAKFPAADETVRLIYVAAYYPQKNIESIPLVAAALKRKAPDRNFEFLITVPETVPELQNIFATAERLGVPSAIRNVGKVYLKEAVELYRQAHIGFMPSLLETFSANFPEAMSLGRPVVASDLEFAHDVCGDAALYFHPTDPEAAADTILRLVNDEALWESCISKGNEVMRQLPDAHQKYELYLDSIRKTLADSKN